MDDVWEASVAEAFERVGLSLLVTTREVWLVGFMFIYLERVLFSNLHRAREVPPFGVGKSRVLRQRFYDRGSTTEVLRQRFYDRGSTIEVLR